VKLQKEYQNIFKKLIINLYNYKGLLMYFQALKVETSQEKKYLITMTIKELKEFKHKVIKKKSDKEKIKSNLIIVKNKNKEVFWDPIVQEYEDNKYDNYGMIEIKDRDNIKIIVIDKIKNLKDEDVIYFELVKKR
jgi:hypothetical protein